MTKAVANPSAITIARAFEFMLSSACAQVFSFRSAGTHRKIHQIDYADASSHVTSSNAIQHRGIAARPASLDYDLPMPHHPAVFADANNHGELIDEP
jgi:hypothetical protein